MYLPSHIFLSLQGQALVCSVGLLMVTSKQVNILLLVGFLWVEQSWYTGTLPDFIGRWETTSLEGWVKNSSFYFASASMKLTWYHLENISNSYWEKLPVGALLPHFLKSLWQNWNTGSFQLSVMWQKTGHPKKFEGAAVTVGRANSGQYIHMKIQFLICQSTFFIEALIILTPSLSDLIVFSPEMFFLQL